MGSLNCSEAIQAGEIEMDDLSGDFRQTVQCRMVPPKG